MEMQIDYSDKRLEVNDAYHIVRVDGEVKRLTPIEYRILLMLVKAPGRLVRFAELTAAWSDPNTDVWVDHIKLAAPKQGTDLNEGECRSSLEHRQILFSGGCHSVTFKMRLWAEQRFRRLDAPERTRQVFMGVHFRNGIEVKQAEVDPKIRTGG